MFIISIPIEPALKVQADSVAASKGTTLGNVLADLLRQWVSSQSVQEATRHTLYETEEVINAKMQLAKEDMLAGRVYTSDEIRAHMHAKYGI